MPAADVSIRTQEDEHRPSKTAGDTSYCTTESSTAK